LNRYKIDALPAYVQALSSEHAAVQSQVLHALPKLDRAAKSARTAVLPLLELDSSRVRRDAALCLYAISPNDQITALKILSQQSDHFAESHLETNEILVREGDAVTFEKLLHDEELTAQLDPVRRFVLELMINTPLSPTWNRTLHLGLDRLWTDAIRQRLNQPKPFDRNIDVMTGPQRFHHCECPQPRRVSERQVIAVV